jgi:hypothetical protein
LKLLRIIDPPLQVLRDLYQVLEIAFRHQVVRPVYTLCPKRPLNGILPPLMVPEASMISPLSATTRAPLSSHLRRQYCPDARKQSAQSQRPLSMPPAQPRRNVWNSPFFFFFFFTTRHSTLDCLSEPFAYCCGFHRASSTFTHFNIL